MASSATIIPPVSIGDFTCAGNGLLYEGHARESPAQLRDLILPSGKVNGISDRDKPKSWWLAQNRFYGLAQAKATPIGILRTKLEEALRSPNGMTVPEKILNLEAEGNRKYQDLLQIVLKETQKETNQATNASTSKGKNIPKATNKEPKAPAVPKASSSSAAKGASKSATKSATKGDTKEPSTSKKVAPSTGKAGPSKSAAKGSKAADPQSTNTGKKSTKAAPKPTPGLRKENSPEFWEIPKPAMHNPSPKKRERSDDLMDIDAPQKRVRSENDIDFEWLIGAYTIIPPAALTQQEVPGNLELAIKLDPDNGLFVEFDFHVCLGVMRSSTAIETRKDGAFAKFEWCGKDGYDFTAVYPPRSDMKGTLRFTRRKRDGRHVLKGVIEGMPACEGPVEFMGERTGEARSMFRRWDDYKEAAF